MKLNITYISKEDIFCMIHLSFFNTFWSDCLWIMVTLHPVEGVGLSQSVYSE